MQLLTATLCRLVVVTEPRAVWLVAALEERERERERVTLGPGTNPIRCGPEAAKQDQK